MQLTDTAPAESEASIDCVPFGKAPDGTPVDLYRLTNRRGLVATITNYGGIVVSLLVPDRDGKLGDVVLGYDTLAEYIAKSPYFGCLVGRYGNRIARGEFTLDGRTYSLAKNDGENHLHGGRIGFDKVVWSAKPLPKRVGSPPAMPAPRVAHHRGRVGEAERSERGGGSGWGGRRAERTLPGFPSQHQNACKTSANDASIAAKVCVWPDESFSNAFCSALWSMVRSGQSREFSCLGSARYASSRLGAGPSATSNRPFARVHRNDGICARRCRRTSSSQKARNSSVGAGQSSTSARSDESTALLWQQAATSVVSA